LTIHFCFRDFEQEELDGFLCAERAMPVVPNLFDRRPSALRTQAGVFARYVPSQLGWPWPLLCCWPIRYTAMVRANNDLFARGGYTSELFETLLALEDCEQQLMETVAPGGAQQIDHIACNHRRT
jgi:hypothetical protein